jgi:outer membrane lipoprotein-sorting protein
MLAQEIHRRDAESVEGALQTQLNSLRHLCVLCVSAVSLSLLLLTVACKTTGGGGGAGGNSVNNGNGVPAGEKSFTPPYQTKEPERYQARMVQTMMSGTQTRLESFIARDGDLRREDYQWSGVPVSDLKTHAGRFLLVPDRKLYADMADWSRGHSKSSDPDIELPEEISAESLVNDTRAEAVYEKLGVEQWDGRAATKYRITSTSSEDKNVASSEQLIWIDEQVGMPVRYETVSHPQGMPASGYSMELLDLKQEVDPSLFVLPQGYRKVTMRELLDLLEGGEMSGARQD